MAFKKAVKRVFRSPEEPEKKKPAIAAEPVAVSQDRLQQSILFVSNEPNKRIKIATFKAGGGQWLPTPNFVEFKDYKYECTSKYIASVLNGKCSPSGIMKAVG